MAAAAPIALHLNVPCSRREHATGFDVRFPPKADIWFAFNGRKLLRVCPETKALPPLTWVKTSCSVIALLQWAF